MAKKNEKETNQTAEVLAEENTNGVKDAATEEAAKEKFQQKLKELLAFAKKKKNMLEYQEINDFFADARLKYIAILAATAFGGCSGIAQTSSLLRTNQKTSSLSITAYIRGRLIVAGITAFLATLLYPLL